MAVAAARAMHFRWRRGRPHRALLTATAAVAALAAIPHPTASAGTGTPRPVDISVQGTNGTGRISAPGRPCSEGGDGASFHYGYRSPLAAGRFSALPAELRLNLDVHAQGQGAPQVSYNDAFLLGEESAATLVNERGTVRLALSSGTCAAPTLAFDGIKAYDPTPKDPTGSWRLQSGTGSYRGAAGTGSFTLTRADVAPGADNPFTFAMKGSLAVLQPNLTVAPVDSYWGFLGADYLLRRVTVVFRVTNTGEAPITGDAFDVRLKDVTASPASSPGTPTLSGVKVLGPVVQRLGDLVPGQSEDVRVRYELGLTPDEPCALVVLSCSFDTTLTLEAGDALDAAAITTRTVRATAPDFPPPL